MKIQSKIQSKIPSLTSKIKTTTSGGDMRHYFCIQQFNSDHQHHQRNQALRKALEKALNEHDLLSDERKHIEAEKVEIQAKIDYFKNYYAPVLEWIRTKHVDLSNYQGRAILEQVWQNKPIETRIFSELMNMKHEIRRKTRL